MDEEYRRYAFHYVSEAIFTPAVVRHYFKLRPIPCNNFCQKVESSLFSVQPSDCLLNESIDAWGNQVRLGSYDSLHGGFRVVSEGVVRCTAYRVVDPMPSDCYLYPSVLTRCDLSMKEWAMAIVGDAASVRTKTERLMRAVHGYLTYQRGVTSNRTTAVETFVLRRGVCQDFAQLMIALCRSVGLRARYVNGLVLGQGETHAWVEVYDGDAWIGFDPTLCQVIDWGYVKIAHGRDVYDCPSNRGQFIAYTGINETLTVKCEMKEI